MWSARTKWEVRKGALESAVHLVQGSFKDWDEVQEAASDGSALVLGQPEKPAPCELTVDFPQSSFFVSLIKISSTARICEVYACKLGSQDHEYVCTVRGQERPVSACQPSAQGSEFTNTKADAPSLGHKEVVGQHLEIIEQAASSQTSTEAEKPPVQKPSPANSSNPQPTSEVPLYSCYIKLARGPAFTSLRFKFLSLQNKLELRVEPIQLYASRGPALFLPPRLTNSSLSGLAPLLPALGPLLGANLPGLPQLPGAFSHLQQLQGMPKLTQAEQQEERKTRLLNAADLDQSRKGDHPAMPEGLAQMMQGLMAGKGSSLAAAIGLPQNAPARVDQKASRQVPPFDLAGLMAALSRKERSNIGAANGLPKAFEPSQRQDEEKSQMLEQSDTESQMLRPSQNSKDQQATLEKVLERLEGLEHTCLRIERAVMGTLSSFGARLKRLEDQDLTRNAETLRSRVIHQKEVGRVEGQEESTAGVRDSDEIVSGDKFVKGCTIGVKGGQQMQEDPAATSNILPGSKESEELCHGGGDASQKTPYEEAEAAANL